MENNKNPMRYQLNDVVKVTLENGFSSYFLIVKHRHSLGFRSLIALERKESIGVNYMKSYQQERMCSLHDELAYECIMTEVRKEEKKHVLFWSLLDAKGLFDYEEALLHLKPFLSN